MITSIWWLDLVLIIVGIALLAWIASQLGDHEQSPTTEITHVGRDANHHVVITRMTISPTDLE